MEKLILISNSLSIYDNNTCTILNWKFVVLHRASGIKKIVEILLTMLCAISESNFLDFIHLNHVQLLTTENTMKKKFKKKTQYYFNFSAKLSLKLFWSNFVKCHILAVIFRLKWISLWSKPQESITYLNNTQNGLCCRPQFTMQIIF